jgi:hypothetical protein
LTKKPIGRPALVQGEVRHKTSVSLTREQQIQFRRLGGSRWLQQFLTESIKCQTAATTTAIKAGIVRSGWQELGGR